MMLSNAVDDVDFGALYESLTGFSLATAKRAGPRDLAVICPIHKDTRPSMSLDVAGKKWYCHVCGIGGGVADLVIAIDPVGFVGGATPRERRHAAFAWIRDHRFSRNDLQAMPVPATSARFGRTRLQNEICTPYDYLRADGTLAYQVLRFDGFDEDGRPAKNFTQRRRLPDGTWALIGDEYVYVTREGERIASLPSTIGPDKRMRRKPSGPWIGNLNGVESLLFQLPDVLRAAARGEIICCFEGERKAKLFAERTGLCATTAHNGARAVLENAWLNHVAGASALWSFADSDKQVERRDPVTGRMERVSPGRDSALARGHFFRRVIFDVRVIDCFPDRADGSDIVEWLEMRPDATRDELVAELRALAAAAPAL